MEMRLLTLLQRLRAWLYVFVLMPALALAQVSGGNGRYYERSWGFWNGFWTVAAIVAVLAVLGWMVSARRRGQRRAGP